MIHFPSTLHGAASLPTRTDSLKLNATQQKAPTHKIFLTIEEELHDARRVHSHGQEEDLRLALNMLIERLSQLSTMLNDAYKSNADLEVQLNVTKSNLTLITANNEMLEDALKQRDATTQNVGWRRTSGRAYSTDDAIQATGELTPIESPAAQETNRFFKFRFTPGTVSASASRPATPGASPAIPAASLNSPSLPVLGTVQSSRDREKELEKELEKEKKAAEEARKEKDSMQQELESLSQALFEEANTMVSKARRRCAEAEDELREANLEKDALRSALRLLEGHATSANASPSIPSTSSSTYASASSSPTLTTSPTSLPETTVSTVSILESSSSSSSSPQRAPPELSLNATLRPAPPQPLDVPTTPFEYDGSSMETPTPRPPLSLPSEDSELTSSTDAKGSESDNISSEKVDDVAAVISSIETDTRTESAENPAEAQEESVVLATSSAELEENTQMSLQETSTTEEETSGEKKETLAGWDTQTTTTIATTTSSSPTTPFSAADEDKRRPPQLDLADPWADAPATASKTVLGESQ